MESYLPKDYQRPTKGEIKEMYDSGMFNSIEWHEERIKKQRLLIEELELKYELNYGKKLYERTDIGI